MYISHLGIVLSIFSSSFSQERTHKKLPSIMEPYISIAYNIVFDITHRILRLFLWSPLGLSRMKRDL